MSDWSSPRQRRNNGLMTFGGMIVITVLLFHLPSRMVSFETVFIVAFLCLGIGVLTLLPLAYDGPYILLGDEAIRGARLLSGFNAEQPQANLSKRVHFGVVAFLEVTYVVNSESGKSWHVIFSEPGRMPFDHFEFYEDGRVYWQEASVETPFDESAWQHAGLVRLKWLTMMLQRYGTVAPIAPRRSY